MSGCYYLADYKGSIIASLIHYCHSGICRLIGQLVGSRPRLSIFCLGSGTLPTELHLLFHLQPATNPVFPGMMLVVWPV